MCGTRKDRMKRLSTAINTSSGSLEMMSRRIETAINNFEIFEQLNTANSGKQNNRGFR